MLEVFRNAAKGWVAKILLSLLVVAFAAWGITDVFRGFQAADLATVGKRSISSEEYRSALNRSLQQLGQQTGNAVSLEDARRLGLDQQVFDRMVASTALDAQADRLKLAIGDEALKVAITANPVFKNAAGQFDADLFRRLLQQNGMSEQGYMASQRSDTMRAALTSVVGEDTTLPQTLLAAMLQYRDETRDGRYFSFSVSEADVPAPSDEEIKQQYEATPVAYTAPEYRSIAVLKAEPSDVAAKIEVTDEELVAAYEESKAEFFTPEKRDIIQVSFPDVAAAEAAKLKVNNGEDLLAIATAMGLKPNDITFAGRTKQQFIDAKIAEAAFNLAEGAMSAPVKGSLNTVLLKAVKVVPEKQATLDEVRDKVKERVQLAKARDELQSIYDAVEDGRAQQMKFEDIATRAGLPLTLVPAVSAAGIDSFGKEVLLPFKDEILKAAFASDVGVENDALNIGEGYAWLEVREVKPSAVRPLPDVKDAVIADWVAAKLRTFASDKAKAVLAKAGSTTKLETLATELNGVIKSVTAIKRNQTSEEFDGVAALALFSAAEKTLTWALEGDGRTARIIEVSKVTKPAFSAGSVAAKEVTDLTRQGMGGDLLDSYVKAVRAEAKVTVNEDLWRQIRGSSTSP